MRFGPKAIQVGFTGLFAVASFAVAAAVPAAAAGDAEVLATIDGKAAVTWYDVYFYYRDAADVAPRAEITTGEVEDAVEALVTGEVILREAEGQGYADEESLRKDFAGYRRKLLREMLGQALARETTVTEEELRAAYEKNTRVRVCSVIVAPTRAEAEAARAELAAGRPWLDVEKKYSTTLNNGESGGRAGFALPYDGSAVAEAVYTTPLGEYTGPVTLPFDLNWYVYRVEREAPGPGGTYEEVRARLKDTLVTAKTLARMAQLAAALRTSATITRNDEAWRDIETLTFAALLEKWGKADVTISAVDGEPVSGEDLVRDIRDYFGVDVDALDAFRAKNSEHYLRAAQRLRERLEDFTILELEARRRGIDKDPEFAYRYKKYRANILTEFYSAKEFRAKLPDITDADVERYYDAHVEEFAIPENAQVYLLAAPARDDVEAARARIARAEDPLEAATSYAAARAAVPANLNARRPEEREFYGTLKVTRLPAIAEEETPLAADLRPRVFPFPGANRASEVFQTADGRWAFFVTLQYEPAYQQTLEEPGVKFECSRRAWAEYYGSEEVDELCRRWLSSLRARHEIELAREKFEEVAARLNALK